MHMVIFCSEDRRFSIDVCMVKVDLIFSQLSSLVLLKYRGKKTT
jgi:hypothetical protein